MYSAFEAFELACVAYDVIIWTVLLLLLLLLLDKSCTKEIVFNRIQY